MSANLSPVSALAAVLERTVDYMEHRCNMSDTRVCACGLEQLQADISAVLGAPPATPLEPDEARALIAGLEDVRAGRLKSLDAIDAELAPPAAGSPAPDYPSDFDALMEHHTATEAALDDARATVKRLNRRCQLAEAAVHTKVEDFNQRSKGALRNFYYAEWKLLQAELAALRQAVQTQRDDWKVNRDEQEDDSFGRERACVIDDVIEGLDQILQSPPS